MLSGQLQTNNVCGRARKGELLYCRARCGGRRKLGWRNQFTGQRCISVAQSAVAEIWPCRLMAAAGPLVLAAGAAASKCTGWRRRLPAVTQWH